MKAKKLLLSVSELIVVNFDELARKLKFKKEKNLSNTYAGRQFGFWAHGFAARNMHWFNRLHKKLLKVDPSIRHNEPCAQELLDECLKRGLCSQDLYDSLSSQYGNRDNGLPAVIDLQPAR